MHPPPDSFVPTPRAARFDLLVRGAPVPSPCVPRDAGWHPARLHSGRSAESDVTLAQHRSRRNPALLLRDPIPTSKGPAAHLGEAPREGRGKVSAPPARSPRTPFSEPPTGASTGRQTSQALARHAHEPVGAHNL